MNTREYLLLNNQFLVAIGRNLYSFTKVSNLSDVYELETLQQGGINQYPEFLTKQKGKGETLVLERGVQKEGLSKEDKLQPGTRVSAVTIIVLDHGRIGRCYSLDYGVITKKEVSPLDAMGNSILIDKLEITHSGLISI